MNLLTIYIISLTFIYLIYYGVIISQDIIKMKKSGNDTIETFDASFANANVPTQSVSETEDGKIVIGGMILENPDQSDTNGINISNESTDTEQRKNPQTVASQLDKGEDSEMSEEDKIYEQAMGQFDDVRPGFAFADELQENQMTELIITNSNGTRDDGVVCFETL